MAAGAARVQTVFGEVAAGLSLEHYPWSPAFKISELLEEQGARVDFHDPHVDVISETRDHPALKGRKSIALNSVSLAAYKAAMIVADHDGVDYGLVAQCVPLLIDTRNAIARGKLGSDNVIKA